MHLFISEHSDKILLTRKKKERALIVNITEEVFKELTRRAIRKDTRATCKVTSHPATQLVI